MNEAREAEKRLELRCPKCGSFELDLASLDEVFPESELEDLLCDVLVVYCKNCKTLISISRYP